MRLCEVLSKPIQEDYVEVEGFLGTKSLPKGMQRKIQAGRIGLNFFCKHCNELSTFCSSDNLYCIGVDKRRISIDAALKCSRCEQSTAEVWFLIVSENDFILSPPKVRILKRCEKLSENATYDDSLCGFGELLDKANKAYHENLGAGASIYLRKIFEQIAVATATTSGIATKANNGKRKKFQDILREVDAAKSIIPREFSVNGYKLYGELSEVLHGSYDEQEGLRKFKAFRRLVIGILDNIKNNQEMMDAIAELGWNCEEVNHEQN